MPSFAVELTDEQVRELKQLYNIDSNAGVRELLQEIFELCLICMSLDNDEKGRITELLDIIENNACDALAKKLKLIEGETGNE